MLLFILGGFGDLVNASQDCWALRGAPQRSRTWDRHRTTLAANEKTEDMHAEFAHPLPGSETTPRVLQSLFRWGAVALVFAALAYAGPLLEIAQNPGFLAPGMRTW